MGSKSRKTPFWHLAPTHFGGGPHRKKKLALPLLKTIYRPSSPSPYLTGAGGHLRAPLAHHALYPEGEKKRENICFKHCIFFVKYNL